MPSDAYFIRRATLLSRRALLLRVWWIALLTAPMSAFGRAGAAAPSSGRWFCTNEDCDPYVYDPVRGDPNVADPDHPIPPGVDFGDLPSSWVCPVCGTIKGQFRPCETTGIPAACRPSSG